MFVSKKEKFVGHLVAQRVKHLSLHSGSAHNVRIPRQSPTTHSALAVEPAWHSLSPWDPPSPMHSKKIFLYLKKGFIILLL